MHTAEQLDHPPFERWNVIGSTARYPVVILHDLPVHPVASGITDIVLKGVVTSQRSQHHQGAGLHRTPLR